MTAQRLYTLLLVTISLCGCSSHLGTLSYVSTKEIRADTNTADKISSNVIGENVHWFVLLDPTFSFPKLDKAVDDALTKAGGDFMTDATVTYKWFFIPVLYYKLTFEVKGDVWKLKPEAPGNK